MSDDEKSVDNDNDNDNDDAASSDSDNEDGPYRLGNNSSDNDSVPEDDDELFSEDEKDVQVNELGTGTKQNDSDLELYDGNEEDDEEEDEDDDDYALQKFNTINKLNYLTNAHPECLPDNYEEIIALTKLTRDEHNNIVDPLHKTIPILTKYEKTRVLGQRAKQIEHGGDIFVKTDTLIIEPHIIAEYELKFKKIPFIIKRPVPGGGFEYWCLSDLEDLNPL